MAENKKKETITGLSKQTEPILVYLISLLGLIFSFMKDKVDKEIRWVYNQAGAVFITNIGLSFAASILGFIPFLGLVIVPVVCLAEIAVFVFTIIALVKAYNGEHYEIPLISQLAKTIWKD